MINTDQMTCKETGITLFWENTHSSIVSPCLFEESSFGGGVFLFWCYSVHLAFWEQRPSILKADIANGTFRVYFILDCQDYVSFLNTRIHYFIQTLFCKPYFWETGQCANSTIMFTSICEGFPYCICHLVWGSVRLGEQLPLEECSRESIKFTSVVCLP